MKKHTQFHIFIKTVVLFVKRQTYKEFGDPSIKIRSDRRIAGLNLYLIYAKARPGRFIIRILPILNLLCRQFLSLSRNF